MNSDWILSFRFYQQHRHREFKFFFSTLLAAFLINVSANGQALQLKESYVVLGNDTVFVQKYDSPLGANGYCLIHVHENETASLEAGFRMLLKYGGSLVTLRHSPPGSVNRNIQFTIQKPCLNLIPIGFFKRYCNFKQNPFWKIKRCRHSGFSFGRCATTGRCHSKRDRGLPQLGSSP